MKARELALMTVLAVIAGASLWWLKSRPEPAQRAADFPSDIDYFMADVRMTTTDESGAPDYQLLSPRIEHFIADDSSRAQTPHLVVFRDPAPPWHLRAESGVMPADGITIALQGEVTVTRAAGPENPATRALTREVTVNTMDKTARTRQPVTLQHGDWDIEGIGLWIDLRSGLMEMSSVRGVYAPQG